MRFVLKTRKPDYKDKQISRWHCDDGFVVQEGNEVFFYSRDPEIPTLFDPEGLAIALLSAQSSKEEV